MSQRAVMSHWYPSQVSANTPSQVLAHLYDSAHGRLVFCPLPNMRKVKQSISVSRELNFLTAGRKCFLTFELQLFFIHINIKWYILKQKTLNIFSTHQSVICPFTLQIIQPQLYFWTLFRASSKVTTLLKWMEVVLDASHFFLCLNHRRSDVILKKRKTKLR